MAQFETTTQSAKSVWKSPDGQREIFEVQLDYNGQTVEANTYSKDIATIGWFGTVETYEKEGKGGRPSQVFVKQPPKEGGFYPSQAGSHSGSTGGGSSKSSYVPKDEKAIQAMWAIGQSVQAHTGASGLDAGDLESVKAYAIELFHMVAEVKAEDEATAKQPAEPTQPQLDVIHEVPDEMPADFLKDVDEIFPGSSAAKPTTEEKPWPPKS